jgi:peptide/nickel transport system ATP-binding protein
VHPYSIGLLQCAPENGEPRDMLPAIPGTVPNLSQLTPGLRFPRTLLCRRGEMQRNAALNAQWRRRPAGGLLVSATGETPCLMYCWNWICTRELPGA